jgi:O-acetyl-ADP-ribose deacetylase (regulator of RNase III)
MEIYDLSAGRRLTLMQGDITDAAVDAIVNAANARMLGGGGVDGAIHAAAGPQLYEACLAVRETEKGVRCPPGEARLTPGFFLPARFVIHTVGPIYESAQRSAPILRQAHLSCLKLAAEHGLASIAFPAISCGVYGYPLAEAADLAVAVCRDWSGTISDIRFVLYGQATYAAWSAAARNMSLVAVQ